MPQKYVQSLPRRAISLHRVVEHTLSLGVLPIKHRCVRDSVSASKKSTPKDKKCRQAFLADSNVSSSKQPIPFRWPSSMNTKYLRSTATRKTDSEKGKREANRNLWNLGKILKKVKRKKSFLLGFSNRNDFYALLYLTWIFLYSLHPWFQTL